MFKYINLYFAMYTAAPTLQYNKKAVLPQKKTKHVSLFHFGMLNFSLLMPCPIEFNHRLHLHKTQLETRKPCCRKETARCRKCSFLLKFANNIHYK